MNKQSQTALAICEVCATAWAIVIVGGTVYLIENRGWSGWSMWSWLGALFLMSLWTWFCPGHAKYDKSKGDIK